MSSRASIRSHRMKSVMSLYEKIDDWKKYPNALDSESQAAVIVGELAVELRAEIPPAVNAALKALSLRGTMRDIASAIRRDDEEHLPNPGVVSIHDVVDVGAVSCALS
jgi:hypothetical protein